MLSEKYGVKEAPFSIVLDKGTVIKQLSCTMDAEKLKAQLQL